MALFTLVITQAQTFTLKSRDIGGQATERQVFKGFGCSGENISPLLSWEYPPAGTMSYAVTMYDPDAPTGSGFWHWVMFDIPSAVSELQSDAGFRLVTASRDAADDIKLQSDACFRSVAT